MTTPLTIDFVSDIACPWCAVGLGALEQALQRLEGEVSAFNPSNSTHKWVQAAKTWANT
jgi:predicted DsbA family dithiol-disulfide isomerase